jgi:hypothetical protein
MAYPIYYHVYKGIHESNSALSVISNLFTTRNKVLQKGFVYGTGPALDNFTRIISTNIKMDYLRGLVRKHILHTTQRNLVNQIAIL